MHPADHWFLGPRFQTQNVAADLSGKQRGQGGHANCLHAFLEPLVLNKGTYCPKVQGSLGMKRYLLPGLEALS